MNASSRIYGVADAEVPTLEFQPHRDAEMDEGVSFNAFCIAGDWSLRNFYTQADVVRERELAERLSDELSARGIVHAFAPNAGAMSGRIAGKFGFSERLVLPGREEVFRNKDVPSEGVPLEPGKACIGGFGGCGIGIATGDGVCIPMHIGRDSALDRSRITGHGRSRTHFSVVDAAAAYADMLGANPGRMTFRCLFALPQDVFGHPCHDDPQEAYNRALGDYLRRQYPSAVRETDGAIYIDLHELVLAQAERAGFRVDRTTPPCRLPADGPFGHTRHPDRRMRSRFNLVIVHRLS
jgi:hypothetical protein